MKIALVVLYAVWDLENTRKNNENDTVKLCTRSFNQMQMQDVLLPSCEITSGTDCTLSF